MPTKPRKRRRLRRIATILAATLLVLALLVAVLVPTLGASIARGRIASAASNSIAGTVEIGALDLSWTGSQRLTDIRILDESGEEVAALDGTLDKALLRLIFAPMNLGEITVRGSARLQRGPSGRYTILDATRPAPRPPPESTEPARVPRGLNATITIDAIDIEIVEDDQSSHIRGLHGGGSIRPAHPATFTLTSESIEHQGNIAGTIKLEVTLENWSSTDGTITPADATIDAELRLEDVPSDLLRALSGVHADLASGLGDSFTLVTTATGTTSDLLASLDFTADHAQTSARVRIASDAIELAEPMLTSAQTLRLARAIPGLAGILKTAEQTLEFPSDARASLSIDALRIPRSDNGLALDQASASAHIDLPAIDALLTVDQGAHEITLAPTTATITLTPETGLVIESSGSATMDGRDAGRFEIAATLAKLFDESGAPAFDAEQIAGVIAIENLDTALAQPWLPDRIDLAKVLGPSLSASVGVEPRATARHAEIEMQSERASATGSLVISDRLVRSGDKPLTFSLRAEPELVPALLGDDPPFELTRPASISAEISQLIINLDRLNEPDKAGGSIAGTLHLRIDDAPAIRFARDEATPITLDAATISAALTPSGIASASGDLAITHSGEPFDASFELDGMNLGAILAQRYAQSAVRGSAAVHNAPVSLLDEIGLTLRDADGEPVALADLASRTLGEYASASLTFEPRSGEIDITGSLALTDLAAELSATLAEGSLRIASAQADGTIRPRTLQAVLETFAPTLDPVPRLAARTAYHIAIGPTSLNLDSGQFANTLDATLTLDRTDIRGLGLKMGDDDRRFLGPVLLDTFTAQVAIKPDDARDANLKLSLALLDEDQSPIGSIALDAERTAGAIRGSANLQGVSLALADRLLRSPGLVSGAAGPTLTSDIEFDLSDGVALTALLETDRLQTTDPISFALREDSIELGPVHATLDLSRAWVNEHLSSSLPVTLGARTRLVLDAETTRLPRPGHAGPMVFDARIRSDRLAVSLDSGEGELLNDLDVHVRTDPQTPDLIRFDAGALRETNEPGSRAIEATGTVQLARDQSGAIVPDKSVLNLRASANNAPIGFLDALFDQGGVLQDLAGASANAEIIADNLTTERGGLRLKIDTPTTTVNLRGRIRDGTFRARPIDDDEQGQIQIASFSAGLSARIADLIPLLSQIEKNDNDVPTTLRIKRLEVPLDGDLTKLNANVDIDLGTAGFRAGRVFAPFMKALSWDIENRAGNRLKPINLRAREGVVFYRNVEIPLGEFTIRLDGEANLADRTIETITYLPFATLSREFGADIEGQIARVLGPLGVAPDMSSLQIPIRVSGSMDAPKASLATDLFVESLRKSFRPEDLLRRGLEDALKGLGGG